MFGIGSPAGHKAKAGSTIATPKKHSFATSAHRKTMHYPPSDVHSLEHDGTASTTSAKASLSRRCIDLLDAQSELRPTNFHTRIKAAGVRDYGEDVAERNIGINGVDLASAQVQAYYAAVSQTTPTPAVARTLLPETELHMPKPRHPLSRSSSNGREKSIKSLTRDARPTQEQSPPSLQARSKARRHHFYAPPLASEQSARELRSESMYVTDTSLKDMTFLEALSDQLQTATSYEEGPYKTEPLIDDVPRPEPSGARLGYTNQSEGARSRRRATISTATVDPVGGAFFIPDELPMPGQPRPSTSRSTTTTNNYVPQPKIKSPKKYYSLASIQTSLTQPTSNASPWESRLAPQLCNPSVQHSFGTALYRNDDADADGEGLIPLSGGPEEMEVDEAASPPPAIPVHLSHCRHPGGQCLSRTRGGSMACGLSSSKLDEIPEQIPACSSSRRQHSISSTTTPTTTASSSASLRPQSRHTANTSVDLTLAQHQHTLSGDGIPTIHPNMVQPERPESACASIHIAQSPLVVPSTFNIDDYISSDDDDEGNTPWRPRGEDEQELLFKDSGYGSMQLPGLFDSIGQSTGTGTVTLLAANATGLLNSGDAQPDRNLEQAETHENFDESSPLPTPTIPVSVPSALQQRRGSAALSLRHAHSTPAVRQRSALGSIVSGAYSSSEHGSDDEQPKFQRWSVTAQRKRSRHPAHQHLHPGVSPWHPKQATIVPGYEVVQDVITDVESESDYEEEDREVKAEFAKQLQERTRAYAVVQQAELTAPQHPPPGYIPPTLHPHHGPVLQLPFKANVQPPKKPQPRQKNPLTSQFPTLPSHQTGVPSLRDKTYQPSPTYQADSEEESAPADIPRNRGPSSTMRDSASPWPGYAYGHGGVAYGHGYGFVRLLPEDKSGKNSRNGSLPGTPAEEKDGFFSGKGKKALVAAGAFGRSDSRGSISSERAKEAIRRLSGRNGNE